MAFLAELNPIMTPLNDSIVCIGEGVVFWCIVLVVFLRCSLFSPLSVASRLGSSSTLTVTLVFSFRCNRIHVSLFLQDSDILAYI